MLKFLFKKPEQTQEEIDALIEANIALRVRLDKLTHIAKKRQVSKANEFKGFFVSPLAFLPSSSPAVALT